MKTAYLLNHESRERIQETLIQMKAVAMLINETTSPDSDNRNDHVNTCAWMIADRLEETLEALDNLPKQK